MKKGKIFTKGQIAVGVMVLGLAAAIWLNSKYLPSDTKYLGEASFVNGSAETEDAVETSAKVKASENDYFSKAQKEREAVHKEAMDSAEELLDNKNLSDDDKAAALEKIAALSQNLEKEKSIENLLKAKGFEKALVIISENGVTAVVSSEGLTSAQTLQIQDVITSETGITIDKIKIVPVAK